MSEFKFGDNKIIIRPGAKALGDYVIFHNTVQITDKSLFEGILLNTSNEGEAKIFINSFTKCISIEFKEDRIETLPSPLDVGEIYKYCIGCKLKPELQQFLFVTMLRCDVDNICYPSPNNGCIRIFIQVLLLFSCKFKWIAYINKNNISPDIAKYIYDIGFKTSRNDFKKLYDLYLKNSI